MKQTPMHDGYNYELLQIVPADAKRVIEVGCSSGAFARAYRKINPTCEYVGTEIEPSYAEAAREHCSRVLVGDIEDMATDILSSEEPFDCWVFGDVLEHLYDPWKLLRRIAPLLPDTGCVVACIPNMQHWSVQVGLNHGNLRYQDSGLLDRTHIRWFTRMTVLELFANSGLMVTRIGGRVFDEPPRDKVLPLLRSLALATGGNPDQAAVDATPLQWVVKAGPAQRKTGVKFDAHHILRWQ